MQWEIVHVPEKPPSSHDQALVDALASTIEPKLANSFVRQLNQICPLENLRHVKRVRRRSAEGKIDLSVILCLSHGCDNDMEEISDDLLQLINAYRLSIFKVKIPRYAALSKEEWEEQCKLWPTSYHPPNNLDVISGFGKEESELIVNYMKVAIQLSNLSCLGSEAANAAVIVDPSSSQIIASAGDETCHFPTTEIKLSPKSTNSIEQSLQYANGANNAEDQIPKLFPKACNQSYTGVSCLNPWGWTAQRPHNQSSTVNCRSKYSWHPLRHAAIVAIENAAARDRQLFPGTGSSEDLSGLNICLKDCSNNIPAKRQKTEMSANEDIFVMDEYTVVPPEAMRPYLCTGFDIYLVREPCTMCAMALVHQRFRRVFYAFPNPNAGALGSIYRLHGEKSLNHHYSVFRVLIPEKTLCEVEQNG